MVKIDVGNSYSKISGLNAQQEKKLRTAISYTIGGSAAFFSGYGPRKKCLIDKKGYFPTGLFARIANSLKADNIPFTLTKTTKPPKLGAVKALRGSVTPYSAQLNAVLQASICKRGIISMPTGTGKSLVIAMLIAELGLKTLVVVPSLEIKKQLESSLLSLLGPESWQVHNIDSKALNTAAGFDCLIIDEAHHSAAKTYQKLNKTAWSGIYYRFFMTATPFRNDTEETLLFESIAGQVIYKLDYKSAIINGYIVPIEGYYIEIPKQKVDNLHTYREVYSKLVVHNEVRNLHTSMVIQQLALAGASTLCLVREVEHGKILSEMSGLPFVSGADDESRDYIRQFNSGGITALIGTTGILGEGLDTKPCEYVVIAGGGKAKSQFMQQVGRSLRNYPGKTSAKVILIKDLSHRYLTRHFNAQKAILKEEYGVQITKLE